MPRHATLVSHDEPSRARPGAARLLIAVPWRQAGLIALCAVGGAAVSTMASTRHARATVPGAQVRLQVPQEPSPHVDVGGPSVLRMELDPGMVFARNDAAQAGGASDAKTAAASMQPAAMRALDEIDAALRLDPPAAGRVVGDRRGVALPGLVAGLLLGLLLAALRELRGGRMRSPREAEWALGAPVLGAIPTLSAKARDACVSGPVPLDGPLERG